SRPPPCRLRVHLPYSLEGRRPHSRTEAPPPMTDVRANEPFMMPTNVSPVTSAVELPDAEPAEVVFDVRDAAWDSASHRAVDGVSLDIAANEITAIIGPSGCGKSTFLRCLNRMNDFIPGAKVGGTISYHVENLYDSKIDAAEVGRRIGMVFQKPNPFPKSIFDNVAFGPRLNGVKGDLDGWVEASLRRAALWNDVKDKLKQSGLSLSGGQQQRLCIARA